MTAALKHRTVEQDAQEDNEIGLILARVRQGLDEIEKAQRRQTQRIHQLELKLGLPSPEPTA